MAVLLTALRSSTSCRNQGVIPSWAGNLPMASAHYRDELAREMLLYHAHLFSFHFFIMLICFLVNRHMGQSTDK